MIAKIKAMQASLRPSEQRVAAFVVAHAKQVVELSIANLAKQADVSEPTVMRFCRAVGCRGFQAFKLQLAQSLSTRLQYASHTIHPDDDCASISHKVFDGAIANLLTLRQQFDTTTLAQAAHYLAQANRIDIYGSGGAGVVAQDAQLKFMRLGIAAVAYSDVYSHRVAASVLQSQDCVLAISNTGRSLDLIHSVELAQRRGAHIIAISASGSPLAQLADVCLSVDSLDVNDCFTPFKARIGHLLVVDALALIVAMQCDSGALARLQQGQQALADKFLSS